MFETQKAGAVDSLQLVAPNHPLPMHISLWPSIPLNCCLLHAANTCSWLNKNSTPLFVAWDIKWLYSPILCATKYITLPTLLTHSFVPVAHCSQILVPALVVAWDIEWLHSPILCAAFTAIPLAAQNHYANLIQLTDPRARLGGGLGH